MWETWEYRKEDLDLSLCHERGIPVLGTNEHHPALDTFGYLGEIAIKLLHELDVEVFKSRITILGGGEFAVRVAETLNAAGAETDMLTFATFASGELVLAAADALVVVEHHDRRELIGERGPITAPWLKEINPGLVIAHICGGVSQRELELAELRFAL